MEETSCVAEKKGWVPCLTPSERAVDRVARLSDYSSVNIRMLAPLFLLSIACRGEEVARVKMKAPGDSGDTTWKGGKVEVWADFKGDWTGSQKDPGLKFGIEVKDGSTTITTVECETSTCSSSVCSNTTTVNNKVSGNCECLMSCKLEAPEGKAYTVSANVSGGGGEFENASLVLRK